MSVIQLSSDYKCAHHLKQYKLFSLNPKFNISLENCKPVSKNTEKWSTTMEKTYQIQNGKGLTAKWRICRVLRQCSGHLHGCASSACRADLGTGEVPGPSSACLLWTTLALPCRLLILETIKKRISQDPFPLTMNVSPSPHSWTYISYSLRPSLLHSFGLFLTIEEKYAS